MTFGLEIDKSDAIAATGEDDLTIAAFQERAGQHDVLIPRDPVLDRRMNAFKPRPAIAIGEGHVSTKFVDTLRRMEIVPVMECPSQVIRQSASDGGFSFSSNTHDDDHHTESYSRQNLCRVME